MESTPNHSTVGGAIGERHSSPFFQKNGGGVGSSQSGPKSGSWCRRNGSLARRSARTCAISFGVGWAPVIYSPIRCEPRYQSGIATEQSERKFQIVIGATHLRPRLRDGSNRRCLYFLQSVAFALGPFYSPCIRHGSPFVGRLNLCGRQPRIKERAFRSACLRRISLA